MFNGRVAVTDALGRLLYKRAVAYCRNYSTTWETSQNITGKTWGLKAQIWTRKSPILTCVLNMSLLMRLEPETTSSPAKPQVKLRCNVVLHKYATVTSCTTISFRGLVSQSSRAVQCNWNVSPSCKVKSSYITTMDKSCVMLQACKFANRTIFRVDKKWVRREVTCRVKLFAASRDTNFAKFVSPEKKNTYKSLCLTYFLCCLTYFEGQKNQQYRSNCWEFWLEEAQIMFNSDGWKLIVVFHLQIFGNDMSYCWNGHVGNSPYYRCFTLYIRLFTGQMKTCTSQTVYFALLYAVTQMNFTLHITFSRLACRTVVCILYTGRMTVLWKPIYSF